MEEQIKSINKILEKIEHALYGNGKPGLISDLRLLCESVDNHHKEVAELRNKSKKDWQWIMTSIIAVSAVLVAFFK